MEIVGLTKENVLKISNIKKKRIGFVTLDLKATKVL